MDSVDDYMMQRHKAQQRESNKKKKKVEQPHTEACGVHFGIACTCALSEPVQAQRLYLEEKWTLYRREVLVPSGIDKHPALEVHMRRAFMVGVASTMSLLFKETAPVSIATDIQNELDEWGKQKHGAA